jgi:hypothetical protein
LSIKKLIIAKEIGHAPSRSLRGCRHSVERVDSEHPRAVRSLGAGMKGNLAQTPRSFSGLTHSLSGVFPRGELQAHAGVDHRGGRASRSARSSGRDESSSCRIGDEVTRNAIVSSKAHPQASMRGSTSGMAIGELELREHRHPEQGAECPSRGELRELSPGQAPAETSGSKESILDCDAPVAESA